MLKLSKLKTILIKQVLLIPNMTNGKALKLHCFLKIKWMIKISKPNRPMIIVKRKWMREGKKIDRKKANNRFKRKKILVFQLIKHLKI